MPKKKTDHGPAPAPLALHAIDERLASLERDMIDGGGEITEEMEAEYADLLTMRADKAGGYVAVIRRLRTSAEGAKAEADRIADHAKRYERSAERIEARMLAAMLARDEKRIDTPLGTVSVRRNSARPVELHVKEDALPERFLRRSVRVDRRELSDALKADDSEALAVAGFGEAGYHLRVS
jgi:hypothetical protein